MARQSRSGRGGGIGNYKKVTPDSDDLTDDEMGRDKDPLPTILILVDEFVLGMSGFLWSSAVIGGWIGYIWVFKMRRQQ